MARFLALIYGEEQRWDAGSPEWNEQNAAGHRAFAEAAGDAIVGGAELERTATVAVSLRADAEGRLARIDGPFLESNEVIGGFYLFEADDLEEAVRLAAMIPEATASHGGVEVRRCHS